MAVALKINITAFSPKAAYLEAAPVLFCLGKCNYGLHSRGASTNVEPLTLFFCVTLPSCDASINEHKHCLLPKSILLWRKRRPPKLQWPKKMKDMNHLQTFFSSLLQSAKSCAPEKRETFVSFAKKVKMWSLWLKTFYLTKQITQKVKIIVRWRLCNISLLGAHLWFVDHACLLPSLMQRHFIFSQLCML